MNFNAIQLPNFPENDLIKTKKKKKKKSIFPELVPPLSQRTQIDVVFLEEKKNESVIFTPN